MEEIIIIGAGAAGLSAALELAKKGIKSIVVSDGQSIRSQSIMAEGGINAAFDSDFDSYGLHAKETLKAGCFLANEEAVLGLCKNAASIVEELYKSGMSFSTASDKLVARSFGGQSVKRTYYASSNTGKQLMHTLIAQTRRFETSGLITRLCNHKFLYLLLKDDIVSGCAILENYTNKKIILHGKVIIASGGLNGLFGNVTGSVLNTGAVTASLFRSGVKMANGEFIQYHPTTVSLNNKNMLITEAVRGEGGRLFTIIDNKHYYFMEDKYSSLGNLMPRDIIAKEEYKLIKQGYDIYLDMSFLGKDVFENKLKGVIEDCKQFLNLDPTITPIKVEPGIHYFMGGIKVDKNHRTNKKGLYAAGECSCIYHGANRLGGNSLLGALYGGKVAANSAIEDKYDIPFVNDENIEFTNKLNDGTYVDSIIKLRNIMKDGLGIIRDEKTMEDSLSMLDNLYREVKDGYDDSASIFENLELQNFILLGEALLKSALNRKESRGAHNRSDYPYESSEYQKESIAQYIDDEIVVSLGEINED